MDIEKSNSASTITFHNHKDDLKICMKKTTELYRELWVNLENNTSEFSKQQVIGKQINENLIKIENHWKNLKKYKQNIVKIAKVYSGFVSCILNDYEESKSIIKSIGVPLCLIHE